MKRSRVLSIAFLLALWIGSAALAGWLAGGSVEAQAGMSLLRVGGTAVDTNNGAAGAGTLRVAIAGNLVLNEDTASASTDAGVQMLAVRASSPANTSGANGDYEPLQLNAGRLWASATIDAALPTGANAIGKLAANSGIDIGDVDVTSIIPGTGATNLGKAVDSVAGGTDTAMAMLGVRTDTPATLSQADGRYAQARLNSKGAQWVALETKLDSANDSVSTLGNVAHDAADSGNPVKVGARATNASITAVANNDRTDLITDLNGRLLTSPYTIPENMLSGVTAAITGTSDTSVIAAQGAGVRIYVTSIMVINSHATVDTVVEVKDGSTVIWRGWAAHLGGGFIVPLVTPLRLTANTALNCANVTTGANVYCSAAGFKTP